MRWGAGGVVFGGHDRDVSSQRNAWVLRLHYAKEELFPFCLSLKSGATKPSFARAKVQNLVVFLVFLESQYGNVPSI